jgi:hypothetical protein
VLLILIEWKQQNPMSTSDLNAYISIKFVSVLTGGLIGMGGLGSLHRGNMRQQQYNI